MHFLEAYKLFPPTQDAIKIYEIRGRRRRRLETTDSAAESPSKSRGKVQTYCIAAATIYDALVHLREVCPEFHPTHANCCGNFYPAHRFPFSSSRLFTDLGGEGTQRS